MAIADVGASRLAQRRFKLVMSELGLAHDILENFLAPYYFRGRLTDPGMEVVSFYADQTAPEGEMTQGHGFPIIGRLRHVGAPLSLGVDLESAFSGDMITVARMALALQRCVDNAESASGQCFCRSAK